MRGFFPDDALASSILKTVNKQLTYLCLEMQVDHIVVGCQSSGQFLKVCGEENQRSAVNQLFADRKSDPKAIVR